MKRFLILLAISFTLLSCGFDDNQNQYLEIVPVSTVEMPTGFRVDSITQIPVTYLRPTPCHQFSNFYYNSIGNERTVAIYCLKNGGQNCNPGAEYAVTVPLNFKPKHTGNYHFRFWIGVNDDGVDQYIEHEVIVDH
ncbi:hypothetical protein [Flavobacterium sp.]